jgi:hypothetical protein
MGKEESLFKAKAAITNWWPHVLVPHPLLVTEAAAAAVPAVAPRLQGAKEHHCPPKGAVLQVHKHVDGIPRLWAASLVLHRQPQLLDLHTGSTASEGDVEGGWQHTATRSTHRLPTQPNGSSCGGRKRLVLIWLLGVHASVTGCGRQRETVCVLALFWASSPPPAVGLLGPISNATAASRVLGKWRRTDRPTRRLPVGNARVR